MPYNPIAPSQDERSNIYFIQWFGLAASIGMLIDYFAILPTGFNQILYTMTSAILLVTLFSKRFDEHFYTLRDEACRWATGFIALCMIVASIFKIADLSEHLGFWSVTGELNLSDKDSFLFILPPQLMMILACIIFFATIQIKSLRA